MPDSTIAQIGANLDKFGTDYQGYIDQLKSLYATDTTTPQLEAFAANQAKQKAKDIGAIRGIQESYGLSGSGQEIKSLEDLMTGYADQYKDYALKIADVNKQNQISGITQLAGMAQTGYHMAQTGYQNALDAQKTRYNMQQDDLSIYMKLYQDYIESGKETPESAQAKATADFYRLTGRNYGGSTQQPSDTPPTNEIPDWLKNMPEKLDETTVSAYTPEQIGQAILYRGGNNNYSSLTGGALYAALNDTLGAAVFDSDSDIKNYALGKLNYVMGQVDRDAIETSKSKLTNLATSGAEGNLKDPYDYAAKIWQDDVQYMADRTSEPERSYLYSDPQKWFDSPNIAQSWKDRFRDHWNNYKSTKRAFMDIGTKLDTITQFTSGNLWLDKDTLGGLMI